jgi:hypothetical protein
MTSQFIRLLVAAVLTSTCGYAVAQDSAAAGADLWLFDGKTLDGWSGDERVWSVQDGAITGETTAENAISQNTFLIWQGGELDDFELTLEFQIRGGNSGIQYRSQDLGDHRVAGYQADLDADHQYIGILYDEQGRGILASRGERVVFDGEGNRQVTGSCGDPAELLAHLKPEDWNQYTVRAEGNRLVQSINGYVSIDVTDEAPDAESSGILALQIHTGPPMKVQFRNIRLRKLGQPPPVQPTESVVTGGELRCLCTPPDRCRPRCCRGGLFRLPARWRWR